MSSTSIPKVVPAQLSFLAIYKPSLGRSDETFHDQIVFYYSKAAKARSKPNGRDPQTEQALREEENEKLRQVGLAQGMVDFARSFSNGEPVDSVETHKSRIVLHELEPGWWILASIDLTQLPPAATSKSSASSQGSTTPEVEYSSREVSPPALLIQQLIRAHSIFLLHHAAALDHLWVRSDRPKFCSMLDRFWSRFASNWDVLLHGSPAVDIFGGMKLAAGGELGMGVGEEEWGSGEREVLEDYARRTDGLVDVMVCRFGEPSPQQNPKVAATTKHAPSTAQLEPWMGAGSHVQSADGVVFSGVGALSRSSLRALSHWVESIYCYGDYAYGVRDNPTADRTRRQRRRVKKVESERSPQKSKETSKPPALNGRTPTPNFDAPPGIPPPIVAAVETSLDKASSAVESASKSEPTKSEPLMASLGDTETWMKYLTLGYGTTWGGKGPTAARTPPPDMDGTRDPSPEVSMRLVEPEPDVDRAEEKIKTQIRQENAGYFIIGLKGDMDDEEAEDAVEDWNDRIPLRTLHVELTAEKPVETPGWEDETPSYEKDFSDLSLSKSKSTRLRPVVYVHRPFIYTFLFSSRTEQLSYASFYRNLHTYFSPLHRPLSNSTAPERVAQRIAAASHPHTTVSSNSGAAPNEQPIYDLVYDPMTLTVHTSLPNIPEPGTLVAEGISNAASLSGWSRVEALNVHSQILSIVASTRRSFSEIERTCKTSRGWWVVWMRLPPSQTDPAQQAQTEPSINKMAESEEFNAADLREAFLVRRARDAAAPSAKSAGSRMGSGMWRLGGPSTGEKMGGAAAGWGPKGLGEGIGIDARRYVEGLLSLNR